MKKVVLGLLVLVAFSCKKKNLSPKSPCVDGTCETQVLISNPSTSYKDGNGYWHVKWFGPNYFTVNCKLAELKPEYIVNKVPLVECNFDSDYWIIFDTLKYTTPMYSYLGWFNDKQFNNPIAIGNYTYTLKDVSNIHPPLNMAGYQLNKHICWDCPYTHTLFGTHSKYNYEPKQNMFLDKSMKGDTANVWIEVVYNSDIGDRDVKNIQIKIVFD
jgi:hypothetical protein